MSSILPLFLSYFILTLGSQLGKKCNMFFLVSFCLSPHLKCNSSGFCSCSPNYPIQINNKSCERPKEIGKKCNINEECSYNNINAYCSNSVCVCNKGYFYDRLIGKCTIENKSSPNTFTLLLQSVALLILGCIIIPYVLALIYHCLYYNKSSFLSNSENVEAPNNDANTNERTNTNEEDQSSFTSLPLYDLAINESDLPPTYDEAVNNCKNSRL